jgi:hypothetical protein
VKGLKSGRAYQLFKRQISRRGAEALKNILPFAFNPLPFQKNILPFTFILLP